MMVVGVKTTCDTGNNWDCIESPDFVYLLPSSEEGDRSITLDTCVDGVAAWDTFLFVIPVQDGTCGQCMTTCGAASNWDCVGSPDFLYLLPSSEEGDRSVTLDTCVDGVAAWDTFLFVIPAQGGTCGQCEGDMDYYSDNDNSNCGNGLSRVTFTAAAGQAYWVVVEGYYDTDVAAPATLPPEL
ncbi:hypothetical protein HaLaN_29556, partial [Haematococcus lacustris]